MRTPAGKECSFYYEDFHRGANTQTCRLIERNRESPPWSPGLCQNCPVPDVLRANACPHMALEAHVEKRLLGLRRQVVVEAVCTKYLESGFDPHIGCGHCHEERPGATIFERA